MILELVSLSAIISVVYIFCCNLFLALFQRFVSTVERVFPYVTLVLTEQSWPPLIPVTVSQRVALHLNTAALPKGQEELHSMMDRYDIIVEEDKRSSADALSHLKALMMQRKERANTNLYVISNQS